MATLSIEVSKREETRPLKLAGTIERIDGVDVVCIPLARFVEALKGPIDEGGEVTTVLKQEGKPAETKTFKRPDRILPLKPPGPPKAPAPPTSLTAREWIVRILTERGDLTRSELIVYAEQAGCTNSSAQQAIYTCRDSGEIEQFEDKAAGGLHKWRLINK